MENKLIAIDASFSSSGYSILIPSTKDVIYASRVCTNNTKEENHRMLYIVDHLLNVSTQYNIIDMVIEGGYGGVNVKSGLMLSKLRGGILTAFARENIFTCEMYPSEIRKWLGDNGAAKKEEIAAWILEMYKDNPIVQAIGPYNNGTGKKKTSDIYDSIGIGVGYLNMIQAAVDKLKIN